MSRPNDNSYLVIEEKILIKHYKDEPCIVSGGETIPCGGPELTGADIGYEVYRPRAIVSEEDMAFIRGARWKTNIASITLEKDESNGCFWLRLLEGGEDGGEWRVLAPKSAEFSGMIEGYAYRPEEIVTRGEKK